MRKHLMILLISLISCAYSAPQKKANAIQKAFQTAGAQLGNNPGNIIGGGLIASDYEKIYYSGINEDGLFSMKTDGSDLKKLTNGRVEYINAVNGWLYYRKIRGGKSQDLGGLYKMKTDGTKECRLSSDEPFYINVLGNWIYYVNWSFSTDICKIKIDGSERKILYRGHFECLTTDGRSLYFGKMAGPGTSILYKGTFDGNEIQPLLKDTVENFFVYENCIYYERDYGKLYQMDKQSLKSKILISDSNLDADYIVPDKNSLYFGGEFGIRKFDLLKRKIETIFGARVIHFELAAGYAYFTTAKWDKNEERHTKSFLIKLSSIKHR